MRLHCFNENRIARCHRRVAAALVLTLDVIFPWVLCFRCCDTGATSVRRGRNRSRTARRHTRHSARAVSPASTPLRMTGYHADRAASARRNKSGSDSARRCATHSVCTKVSAVEGVVHSG